MYESSHKIVSIDLDYVREGSPRPVDRRGGSFGTTLWGLPRCEVHGCFDVITDISIPLLYLPSTRYSCGVDVLLVQVSSFWEQERLDWSALRRASTACVVTACQHDRVWGLSLRPSVSDSYARELTVCVQQFKCVADGCGRLSYAYLGTQAVPRIYGSQRMCRCSVACVFRCVRFVGVKRSAWRVSSRFCWSVVGGVNCL